MRPYKALKSLAGPKSLSGGFEGPETLPTDGQRPSEELLVAPLEPFIKLNIRFYESAPLLADITYQNLGHNIT